MSKQVVAVIQVMRHTRNIGQETTAAGAGIAFRMGERTGEFLKRHGNVSRAIKQRGFVYFGRPSHQGRAIQTEEQVYQGLVSNAFIRRYKKGGASRQLPGVTDVGKTPAGAEQYKRDVAGLAPSVVKLLAGEPQPHYAEDIESVKERIGVIKKFEDVLKTAKVGRKTPVPLLNVVSHSLDPYAGPSELIAEQLTGRTIQQLGGIFKHAEGVRRVIYSDGKVETHVFRQDPKKRKVFLHNPQKRLGK